VGTAPAADPAAEGVGQSKNIAHYNLPEIHRRVVGHKLPPKISHRRLSINRAFIVRHHRSGPIGSCMDVTRSARCKPAVKDWICASIITMRFSRDCRRSSRGVCMHRGHPVVVSCWSGRIQCSSRWRVWGSGCPSPRSIRASVEKLTPSSAPSRRKLRPLRCRCRYNSRANDSATSSSLAAGAHVATHTVSSLRWCAITASSSVSPKRQSRHHQPGSPATLSPHGSPL